LFAIAIAVVSNRNRQPRHEDPLGGNHRATVMIDALLLPTFWIGIGQIIIVNVVLSGDNAVVIALAARSLPERLQKAAVVWGSVAAIAMRVVLTIAAVELLRLPYLKLAGGVLLLWIAVQLLISDSEDDPAVASEGTLFAAIRTILMADLVMSLDNVLGVAAAAKGDVALLILGLAISIPLIIFGSSIMLRLMNRYPIVITAGAALLGWVAGEMLISDPILVEWAGASLRWSHVSLSFGGHVELAAPAGALLVVVLGRFFGARAAQGADRRQSLPS
jgi:YjbE family integral membrane protein